MGVIWGALIIGVALTSSVRPGITTVAIALAGIGLILKTIQIFNLGGGF